MMTFRVVSKPSNNHVRCPYRIVEQTTGREIDWINRYLDYEMLRRLADTTLRTYAHELLHFLRWWESVHHTDAVAKDALTESTLLDYVRFQSGQERELTGATINQRVAIVDRALRIVFPDAPLPDRSGVSDELLAASTHGHRKTAARLEPVAGEDSQTDHRASVCRRGGAILVQLPHLAGPGHRGTDAAAGTAVARSPGSESRRSAAVRSADPRARQGQQDPFPAAGPGSELNSWTTISGWSGPQTSTNALFVSLKGPARGARMTPAGLRSLFRHHRRTTGVKMANPHRFRHTFASDMVRAGVSLPALMQLMGHAHIQTTLVYVQVTPLEVYQQYARAVAQHIRPVPVNAIVKLSRHAPLDHPLAHQFQRAVESLTAASGPDSARQYRGTARNFLIYLGEDHPAVCSLNQLRRDPHILGWFAHLRSHTPPLAQAVYLRHLLYLRSILEELAWTAQLPDLAHLIRREDFPRTPQRLPRPLTAEQDQLLQQELLRRNDLPANVFLLLRHTGMRIGECVDLSYDCLHHVGPDRWAIHVPLGKLKTERMVPVDSFVCELVQRLRFFRSFDPLPADGRLLARHKRQADADQTTAPISVRRCGRGRYFQAHRSAPT